MYVDIKTRACMTNSEQTFPLNTLCSNDTLEAASTTDCKAIQQYE